MEEFDYKKFLVENKLTINSRLLNEETTMDRLEAHAGFDVEDGITTSDQGFVFDNKGDKLSTALVYTDYGSDREEGERALDPLVDELEKQLENAGAEYKITTTGRAYLVDIMIKNLDGTYLNEEEKLDYKIVDELKNLYFDLEKPIEDMLRNYSILMNKYKNNYSGKSDAEERDFSSTITFTKSKDWGILKKVDKLVDLILKSNLKVNKDGVRLHDAILSLGQDIRGYFDSYDDGTSNVFKLISSEDDGLRIVGIKQKYKEIKELIDKLQTPIQSRPDF